MSLHVDRAGGKERLQLPREEGARTTADEGKGAFEADFERPQEWIS